jgi:hypothetical protein
MKLQENDFCDHEYVIYKQKYKIVNNYKLPLQEWMFCLMLGVLAVCRVTSTC